MLPLHDAGARALTRLSVEAPLKLSEQLIAMFQKASVVNVGFNEARRWSTMAL
jgi:hypothetical protein